MILNQKAKTMLEYGLIVFVAAAFACSYHLFVVGNQFAPAGLNGIATMIQYKFGFSIGYFSLILNIPLCAAAFFMINRSFAVKSLVFCLVYSFSYLALGKLDLTGISYITDGGDVAFPCIIAGLLSGLSYGICFRCNASTGGTDIVAKYISRRAPLLNFFWVTFAMNACVAAISFFVYAVYDPQAGCMVYHYRPVCLCMIYCFVSSFVGNAIIKGTKSAYEFVVITTHADEISDEIIRYLKHSATRMTATGAFSGKEKDVLICLINKHQIVDFRNIIAKYEDTFAYAETATEVIGNFKRIPY